MATEVQSDSSALIDDFYHLFNISKPIDNDTQRPHPKFASYGRKFGKNSNENIVKKLQDQRRKELLDNIKRRREQIIDNLRPLISYIENDDGLNIVENAIAKKDDVNDLIMEVNEVKEDSSLMQVDPHVDKLKKCRNKRNRLWWQKNEKEFRKLISKQLMLSEWLVDVPTDFYSDWYMMFCPRGKRTLVIAANGHTKIYSRTGYFMFYFQSSLPGGGRNSSKGTNTKSSILDCVYVEENHTFYVLDVISWNGCTFLDCETEFRFFWLHSRFNEEVSNLSGHVSKDVVMAEHEDSSLAEQNTSPHLSIFNQSTSKLYDFIPLSYYDCTIENIQKYAKGPYQFDTEIDGVLFFHKRAPYTSGITPLVCWLKVSMISNILHISLD